jgi:type IV pilus assembly protein PilX
MIARSTGASAHQSGIVLVTSLLLLLVVTLMVMSMFRSFGIQEKIAGSLREKERALHAAVTAQQEAEWWLAEGTNAASAPVNCNGLLSANLGEGQICSNRLSAAAGNVSGVPWQQAGVDIGVSYTPPAMTVSATSAAGTYYGAPRYYVADLGPSASGQGEVFQIDAAGYGGTADAVAVVESTYMVSSGVIDRGAL